MAYLLAAMIVVVIAYIGWKMTSRSPMNRLNTEGGDTIEFAGYDPPWTPGPLRRNEILIRLN